MPQILQLIRIPIHSEACLLCGSHAQTVAFEDGLREGYRIASGQKMRLNASTYSILRKRTLHAIGRKIKRNKKQTAKQELQQETGIISPFTELSQQIDDHIYQNGLPTDTDLFPLDRDINAEPECDYNWEAE